MIELTNDLQYGFPVLVAVLMSRWVGSFHTQSIFDHLMQFKAVLASLLYQLFSVCLFLRSLLASADPVPSAGADS
jgi:hypothetical protein